MYVIKSNDQACSVFRNFKLQAENTSEQRNVLMHGRIDRGDSEFSIKQTAYAKKVLGQFGMLDCNTIKSPWNKVRSCIRIQMDS